eukprot:TRINITY_DN19829_c0_g1_i1.p1 TRINITY_DN19829_c0_g1~~TRINITY_DN19829_c0_g1_i1.p1  ORF type:complete len:232 (+),score=42.93 TRINITY_DN19829_c0_g1_i1:78-773(+)
MDTKQGLNGVTEQLVFTPFDIPSLSELKGWISRDSQAEVKATFGPSATDFSSIEIPFVPTLAEHQSMPNAISMTATIRTSYRSLIHIGYIYVTHSPAKHCYINCIYLNKVFRQKDYEYRILKQLVAFLVNNLKCTACFIWIFACNYLFLSIARTLGFRLTRTQTDKAGTSVRYCYAITERLDKEIRSPAKLKARVPNMKIPDYLKLKSKLVKINIEQKVIEGSFKRKDGVV